MSYWTTLRFSQCSDDTVATVATASDNTTGLYHITVPLRLTSNISEVRVDAYDFGDECVNWNWTTANTRLHEQAVNPALLELLSNLSALLHDMRQKESILHGAQKQREKSLETERRHAQRKQAAIRFKQVARRNTVMSTRRSSSNRYLLSSHKKSVRTAKR